MEIRLKNENAFDDWEKENKYEMPFYFKFEYRFDKIEAFERSKSIGEVIGECAKRAIEDIENRELFDDYDDFVVNIEYLSGDGTYLEINVIVKEIVN